MSDPLVIVVFFGACPQHYDEGQSAGVKLIVWGDVPLLAQRPLESEGAARVAGLRVTLIAEVLDPVEVRFVAVAGRARVAHLRLAATAKSLASADAALPAGTTLDVFTVPGFRRIGIARLLWPWAAQVTITEQMTFRPLHSPSRTRAGQEYAESVGGEIPALAGGRYAECPELFDPTNALWRARQHLKLEARRPRNETADDDADDRVDRRGGRRFSATSRPRERSRVNSQISRDHHTVPRLYLRGFCARRGPDAKKVMVRHRDGREGLLSIKSATVQLDFYDPGTTGAPDDSLEHWLGRGIESPVGEIMVALRDGIMPSTANERGTLARFIAVQMVRTIAFRDQLRDIDSHLWPWFFAAEVVRRVVENDASLKDNPDQLRALHEYYASRAPQRPRAINTDSLMRTMIREADRLLPVLLSLNWMLAESSTPQLLTGDTPVVTVNPTGKVTYGPMLLPELHEVHLPMTPERLLTISPLPLLGTTAQLTTDQAGIVNRAIIRTCATSVFRRPDMQWPSDLALPPQRSPLHTPTVNISRRNGQPAKKPEFPAIADKTLKDALDLLGGNPEITWP